MIRQLTDEQKDHVQSKIREVINGKQEEWLAGDEHYPLMALKAAILEIDGVVEVDRETNGWTLDYWQFFKSGNQQFTLGGSGYHGGQTFRKREQPWVKRNKSQTSDCSQLNRTQYAVSTFTVRYPIED